MQWRPNFGTIRHCLGSTRAYQMLFREAFNGFSEILLGNFLKSLVMTCRQYPETIILTGSCIPDVE